MYCFRSCLDNFTGLRKKIFNCSFNKVFSIFESQVPVTMNDRSVENRSAGLLLALDSTQLSFIHQTNKYQNLIDLCISVFNSSLRLIFFFIFVRIHHETISGKPGNNAARFYIAVNK